MLLVRSAGNDLTFTSVGQLALSKNSLIIAAHMSEPTYFNQVWRNSKHFSYTHSHTHVHAQCTLAHTSTRVICMYEHDYEIKACKKKLAHIPACTHSRRQLRLTTPVTRTISLTYTQIHIFHHCQPDANGPRPEYRNWNESVVVLLANLCFANTVFCGMIPTQETAAGTYV